MHVCTHNLSTSFSWFEIFPHLYSFSRRQRNPRGHTCRLWIVHTSCLACHPCNFWGNTCILFTLRNRCISFYATHITYAAFPQRHQHPVYFRKQVHILLCHPCNLCGMSKESSSWYPTLLPWIKVASLSRIKV